MRRDLYSGITAVRIMADDLRAIAELARAARAGEIAGPDLYYAAIVAGPSFFEDPRTAGGQRRLDAGRGALGAGDRRGDRPAAGDRAGARHRRQSRSRSTPTCRRRWSAGWPRRRIARASASGPMAQSSRPRPNR